MKKIILTGFIIIITLYFGFSQTDTDIEKIKIFTDRDLYITGENILTGLVLISDKNMDNSVSFSKIVFVELFDKKQTSILKRKVKLINNSSEIFLKIPDNIDTDNYFLIAYTKHQKYSCQNSLTGKIINIINPNYIRFDVDTTIYSSKLIPVDKDIVNKGVKISLNRKKYKTRENVDLRIFFSDIKRPGNYKYILSVVRKGTINNIPLKIIPEKILKTNNISNFLNEKRLNLSGILTDKETNNPIQDKEIYLSGLNSEKQIHVVKTNSYGRFNFSLYNFNGIKDFYLRTEPEVDNAKIQIYNEFLNSCIPEKKVNFHLSVNKKTLIEEMFLNQQLSHLEGSKKNFFLIKTDTLISQFGKPDFKIYLKNFVKLPTLHEVFDEIIPSVRVREENHKYVLSIYDEALSLNYNKPLILLDNIPVFNVDDILKIKPSLINNIEIINKMYISGNKIFNGIIILNSNSDKFCRISLPENAKFFRYQGFTNFSHPIFPEYNTSEKKKSKIPDFRNTLYWESGNLPNKGNMIINFFTSDYCAEYVVNLYLTDKKGHIIKNTKTFIVEK